MVNAKSFTIFNKDPVRKKDILSKDNPTDSVITLAELEVESEDFIIDL